jgi:hypothetical protein
MFAALTADHAFQLRIFPCEHLDTEWGSEIAEMIRDRLAYSLAAHEVEGIGCWDEDGLLSGLIAYKPDVDPEIWRIPILAVRYDCKRQHIGIHLKGLVMDLARDAGALVVASLVHRENGPMRWLNDQLGADSEPYPPYPDEYLIYTLAL